MSDSVTLSICQFGSIDRGWESFKFEESIVHFVGWLAPDLGVTLHGRDAAEAVLAASGLPEEAHCFSAWLERCDGHFSFMIENANYFIAAVDWIRSYPVFWGVDTNGSFFAGPDAAVILDLIEDQGPNKDACLELAASGYACGDATMYRSLHQIRPGSMIWKQFDGELLHFKHRWYRPYAPPLPIITDREVAKRALTIALEYTFKRLVADLNGRPAYIPISAGLDSRLVLSGLVAHGHTNIVAFSYGLKNNSESWAGRKIAARLGVQWQEIRTSPSIVRKFAASERFKNYLLFADTLASTPFVQDLPALEILIRDGLVPDDAVFINGNSGDFLSGGHIPAAVFNLQSTDLGAAKMIDIFRNKHFTLWTKYQQPNFKKRIEDSIRAQLSAHCDIRCKKPFALYEALEWAERQSKFVVSGQRVYDFLGYQWRLPLWEAPLRDVFERLAPEFKVQQNLYRETLLTLNWGDVWRDIPVNKKVIQPEYIRPIRMLAKLICAPFGRSVWKKIERRFFSYWTNDLSTYAFLPIIEVIFGESGFRNAVALRTKEYLKRHGQLSE